MVYFIQVCWQLASGSGRNWIGSAAAEPNQFRPDPAAVEQNQFRPDPFRKLSANLYDIYHCCVAEPSQFRPDPVLKLSANLYEMYHCCVYSEKLLMMDRETVRNM